MLTIVAIRKAISQGCVRTYKVPLRSQLKYGIIIGTAFGSAALFQQIGLVIANAGTTVFITLVYTVLVPMIPSVFV